MSGKSINMIAAEMDSGIISGSLFHYPEVCMSMYSAYQLHWESLGREIKIDEQFF